MVCHNDHGWGLPPWCAKGWAIQSSGKKIYIKKNCVEQRALCCCALPLTTGRIKYPGPVLFYDRDFLQSHGSDECWTEHCALEFCLWLKGVENNPCLTRSNLQSCVQTCSHVPLLHMTQTPSTHSLLSWSDETVSDFGEKDSPVSTVLTHWIMWLWWVSGWCRENTQQKKRAVTEASQSFYRLEFELITDRYLYHISNDAVGLSCCIC